MPAYVIADIDVHDAAKFEEYKKHAGPGAAEFDGRYVVRGGALEASAHSKFVVVEGL